MTASTLVLKLLRDAAWLHEERAGIIRMMLAVLLTAACIGWVVFSRSGLDLYGKPLGTDFLSFWTASKLALGGDPAAPYDIARHNAAQLAVFDAGQGYAAFFYPPVYLLLCLPLATMPYLTALLLWLGLSGAAYVLVVHRYLDRWSGTWLTLLAFPAVLVNLGHGQNGFVTAALAGGACLLLDRRPWLAGVLFGCLAIKPHLALLLPLVLAARRLWRPCIAAGLTVAALVLLSAAVFGLEAWQAFLANARLAQKTLETGLVDPAKMQSVFAAVRVLDGPTSLAYGLQAIVALGVMATLIAMARRHLPSSAQNAAWLSAAVVVTPFVLDYDLTWIAFPLAWLFLEARRTHWLPWERIIMGGAFVLPLFARPLAMQASLPIAPLLLIALFCAVARRAFLSPGTAAHRQP